MTKSSVRPTNKSRPLRTTSEEGQNASDKAPIRPSAFELLPAGSEQGQALFRSSEAAYSRHLRLEAHRVNPNPGEPKICLYCEKAIADCSWFSEFWRLDWGLPRILVACYENGISSPPGFARVLTGKALNSFSDILPANGGHPRLAVSVELEGFPSEVSCLFPALKRAQQENERLIRIQGKPSRTRLDQDREAIVLMHSQGRKPREIALELNLVVWRAFRAYGSSKGLTGLGKQICWTASVYPAEFGDLLLGMHEPEKSAAWTRKEVPLHENLDSVAEVAIAGLGALGFREAEIDAFFELALDRLKSGERDNARWPISADRVRRFLADYSKSKRRQLIRG